MNNKLSESVYNLRFLLDCCSKCTTYLNRLRSFFERHPPFSEIKVLSWNEAQVPSVGRPTVASMLLTTSAPVMRDTRSRTEGLTFSARLMPSRSKLS